MQCITHDLIVSRTLIEKKRTNVSYILDHEGIVSSQEGGGGLSPFRCFFFYLVNQALLNCTFIYKFVLAILGHISVTIAIQARFYSHRWLHIIKISASLFSFNHLSATDYRSNMLEKCQVRSFYFLTTIVAVLPIT